MTAPLAVGGYPPRRKTLRELLADSAALPQNDVPSSEPTMPGRYALSEVADASIDHTQPEPVSGRDRILRALTGAAAGLTSQYRTSEPGADRFLGGVGSAFLATRGVAEGYEDRDREIQREEMSTAERIRLRLRQEAQDRLDQENIDRDDRRLESRDAFDRENVLRDDRRYSQEQKDRRADRKAPTPVQPWWVKEGYTTEAEGLAGERRRYPERHDGRAPTGGAPETDEREYTQQRIRELTRPRYDNYGSEVPGSAISIEQATARARQEYRASVGQTPRFDDVQGGSSTGGKPKSPADRWEELVNGGMSEADATAKVRQEMGGQ